MAADNSQPNLTFIHIYARTPMRENHWFIFVVCVHFLSSQNSFAFSEKNPSLLLGVWCRGHRDFPQSLFKSIKENQSTTYFSLILQLTQWGRYLIGYLLPSKLDVFFGRKRRVFSHSMSYLKNLVFFEKIVPEIGYILWGFKVCSLFEASHPFSRCLTDRHRDVLMNPLNTVLKP